MKHVVVTADLDAPPARVWEVVMDPARLQEWVTIHRRVGRVSDTPLRDGSTIEQHLHLRGATFKVTWKVVELERPKLAVWEGKGPAHSRARTVYRLSPLDGGGRTHFEYENALRPPLGALGAAASRALVGRTSEREAQRSLVRLEDLLTGD